MAARLTSRALAAAVWLLLAPLAGAAHADDALEPGDPFPEVTLEDQHGRPHTLDAGVRLVLFSADMDAGDIAEEALEEDGASLLEAARAVSVSDIERMPALVTKLFALPSMRRRPYPMLLDRDGETTSRWPAEPGRVTLLTLRDSTLVSVEAFDAAAPLREVLVAAGAPVPVEQQIVGLEQRRYRALVDGDEVALEAVLDAELVYTHANGRVHGKAGLIEALRSGELDYRDVESRVEGLSIVGDVAVVSGRAELGLATEGRDFDRTVRYTAVYARRDGAWRLIAYQSTGLDGS
ncbi:MAG: DUF4440 domain-containing protein [Myxococcota bacterium]